MKQEYLAGILLFVILATAGVNLFVLKNLTGEIETLSTTARTEAEQGDWANAETAAESAAQLWSKRSTYAQAVLRQAEYDRVSDALSRLVSAVYNRESGTAKAAAEQITEVLDTLLGAEIPTAASIF